jgi:Fe-S cluster biogenesis protein NfuA/nitrite reductase/ring-hydroxylating ferredoxin subunit
MAEAAVTLDDSAARDRVATVERLLDQVEHLPDPVARRTATDLAAGLLELYGEGLARLVSHVADHDHDGELARLLADDELVAHLLLLHGLHPVPLELRVRGALDGVRPYLESHGGDVELLGIDDGIARLRLQGSCKGCPSSAATLKLAIEEAIHEAAPDVGAIEAEGAVAAGRDRDPAGPALLQIELSEALKERPGGGRAWTETDATDLVDGDVSVAQVSGERVLFLRLSGRLYAYRPDCPGCGASLEDAALAGTQLTCPGCARRYDARRAGRCADEATVHLDPVPLLPAGEGHVKVALGAGA